jgi:hypothetical protein
MHWIPERVDSSWTCMAQNRSRLEAWMRDRVHANACRANFQPGQSASSIDDIDGRSGKSGQHAPARNSSTSCRPYLVCSGGRHVGSMCAKSLHDTRPSGHGNTGAPPCAGTRSCRGAGGSSLMGRSRRGGGGGCACMYPCTSLRGELMDIESAICICICVACADRIAARECAACTSSAVRRGERAMNTLRWVCQYRVCRRIIATEGGESRGGAATGRRGMGEGSKRLAGGGRVALEGLGQEVLAGVVGVGKGPFGAWSRWCRKHTGRASAVHALGTL